jgi:predicted cobalt transporter CbtA
MPSASPATDPFGSVSRLLGIGLLAGLAASIPYTIAQHVWVAPLLRSAETLEPAHPEHNSAEPLLAGWPGAAMSNAAAGVGYALLLAAGISLRRRPLGIRSGLMWGLGGFAVLALLPALTLPVGLPGLDTGPLPMRQVWWALAVVCAAAGLSLVSWAPGASARIAGALIALAPPIASRLLWDWPETPAGLRGLQTQFGLTALGASALFWLLIGTITGLMVPWARSRR